MNFNKFSNIFITICSVLYADNISEASVICEFSQTGKCFIECDGVEYPFNSLKELSNDINSITDNYFTVDSVTCTPDYDTILFINFNNCRGANAYNLTFRGTKHFLPNIELNYGNNEVIFPKINLEHIMRLNIKSKKVSSFNDLPKLKITEDQNHLEMDLDDETVYCSIF